MKRKALERHLAEHGCRFKRHGANHDAWLAPNGRLLTIPRHRELKPSLVKAICRDAEVEPPRNP